MTFFPFSWVPNIINNLILYFVCYSSIILFCRMTLRSLIYEYNGIILICINPNPTGIPLNVSEKVVHYEIPWSLNIRATCLLGNPSATATYVSQTFLILISYMSCYFLFLVFTFSSSLLLCFLFFSCFIFSHCTFLGIIEAHLQSLITTWKDVYSIFSLLVFFLKLNLFHRNLYFFNVAVNCCDLRREMVIWSHIIII